MSVLIGKLNTLHSKCATHKVLKVTSPMEIRVHVIVRDDTQKNISSRTVRKILPKNLLENEIGKKFDFSTRDEGGK
jgi:hypothetical protein